MYRHMYWRVLLIPRTPILAYTVNSFDFDL